MLLTEPPRRLLRRSRSGAVTLETILALPVLLLALLAIFAFGALSSSLQQLELAAREGARAAAETGGLPMVGPVPVAVTNAVERHFAEASATTPLSPSEYEIRLVHNVGIGGPFALTSNAGGLVSPPENPLSPPPPSLGRYVRVTVAARGSALAPNVLSSFGFDLEGYVFEQTVLLPYEL